jgi:alpha-tubulin suppressor-like RCC1 family protein
METGGTELDVFDLRELTSLREERVCEVISKGLFTMFLTSNHKVWGCGHNEFFQLGLGHTQKVQLPVNISAANSHDFGKLEIAQVECGYDHTCFLTIDGQVWACGINENGQLGLHRNYSEAITPVKIDYFEQANVKVKHIVCGGHHSLFILQDESLLVCGANEYGQCSQGHFEDVFLPTPLPEQFQLRVADASCGRRHTILITRDHGVWVCGENVFGQLGLTDTRSDYPLLTNICVTFKTGSEMKLVRSAHCGFNYSYFLTSIINFNIYHCS